MKNLSILCPIPCHLDGGLACSGCSMSEVARLIFEDGTVFAGTVFAGKGERTGELVFNTGLSGYQEVLTDPSYEGQMVMMTYPLIGNYGINDEDFESKKIYLEAFLVREYCDKPSNWRSKRTVKEFLNAHQVLGVEGLDTRAITRYVREKGAQRALLTTSEVPVNLLIEKIKSAKSMVGLNLAKTVTAENPFVWPMIEKPRFKVAVLDCGVKYNILRMLSDRGCECSVFPLSTSSHTILSGGFDGVFLSNGPGDPEPVEEVIQCVRELLGKKPIFGICLGHQILSLALGGKTYKLKFGHHGVNHPVKNLKTGKVEITSQNHGFCVDTESLKGVVEATHINLYDGTNEGIRHLEYPAFSVQYHPESAPGPHDSEYLFDEFIALMRTAKP